MVDPDLQAALDAMSVRERLERVKHFKSTVQRSQTTVTEEQKSLARSHARDLQAASSIGLTWQQLAVDVVLEVVATARKIKSGGRATR